MLVLTRRAGQSFKIGDDIKIHILANPNNTNQIKVGIDAPRDVTVLRTELVGKEKK